MRDNNGKFTKGNQVAKKSSVKSYFNDATYVLPKEVKVTETNSNDYIPFGSDNLFPNKMAEINRKSAVSRAVISSKKTYIIGQGLETENTKFKTFFPNQDATINDLNNNLVSDKLVSGNSYVEVILSRNRSTLQLSHIDTTKVRIHKNRTHVIVHPDWKNYSGRKQFAKVLPLYPMFEMIDGFQRSVYQMKEYEQEFDHYGIPSNLASIDSAFINYKTNKWNLSRLDNAFNLSGIMMLQANFSEEQAHKFDEEFKRKFTGEGRQGQLLNFVSEIGSEPNSSKFIPIATNEEGNWLNLHNQATSEIVIGNQWFSSLAGLDISSGFDTSRIRNDYQVAMSTVIPKEQKPIIEMYQDIFDLTLKVDLSDLKFINKSPISLVDISDFHTSVIALNTEVKEGRMTKEMARLTLKYSYQLSNEDVNELFV